MVSRLRTGRGAKSTKDVQQASVLCAALAELHPGAIEEAVELIISGAITGYFYDADLHVVCKR